MGEYTRIHPHQVEYLLRWFAMSRQDLLDELNKDRKRKFTDSDVFTEKVKLSTLNAIDKVFRQGLDFYHDSIRYDDTLKHSMPSKKPPHLTALALPDKQLVAQMEDRTAAMEGLICLTDMDIPETLDKQSITTPPASVASEVREKLAPDELAEDMPYLSHLVDRLASSGVGVIEHVGHAIKNSRNTNLAGFFIKPKYIILVRNMLSVKNEIFTLVHELGHYLLNKEGLDMDLVDNDLPVDVSLTKEERWCNEFAFGFLASDLDTLNSLEAGQDVQINEYSERHHLSKLAIYRHLLDMGKMSADEYMVKRRSLISMPQSMSDKGNRPPGDEMNGNSRRRAVYRRPIFSKLEKRVYAEAYHLGILGETELLAHLRTRSLESVLHGS